MGLPFPSSCLRTVELSEGFFLVDSVTCRILTHPFPKRSGHPALLATPGASSINSAAFHKTPFPLGLSSKCVSVRRDQSCSGQLLSMQRQGPHSPEREGWRLWARRHADGSCVHMGGGWCSFSWLLRAWALQWLWPVPRSPERVNSHPYMGWGCEPGGQGPSALVHVVVATTLPLSGKLQWNTWLLCTACVSPDSRLLCILSLSQQKSLLSAPGLSTAQAADSCRWKRLSSLTDRFMYLLSSKCPIRWLSAFEG